MTTTKRRCRPPKGAAPTTGQVDTAEFTAPWRQDWNEPLTAEDRADLDVLIAAAERGFRLSTRCLDCGHWISAPRSVRRHRGPKCHAKAVAS